MGLGGFARYDFMREELLVLNTGQIFLASVFAGITFHTQKSTLHSLFANAIAKFPNTPIPK